MLALKSPFWSIRDVMLGGRNSMTSTIATALKWPEATKEGARRSLLGGIVRLFLGDP